MKNKKIIIAIDGHSSCGKSTIAKAIAKNLNYIYIDSGAMYRAVAVFFLENKIDITDRDDIYIFNSLKNMKIEFKDESQNCFILLNGIDVSSKIRTMEVSSYVAKVSSLKSVRKILTAQQREMAIHHNIVMDGRDIGSSVFPDASVKIFMTADLEVRATRRLNEMRKSNEKISMEEITNNLVIRDHLDSTRVENPLIQVEDATVLDNSRLTHEEQLSIALGIIKNKMKISEFENSLYI
ncbi:MAG: (d)CMP kinase [Pedobacter sp.]|uniref:(d)CMP kinase n=1 Tax=Pedobacter sp. TaxID=1411316 RepID=UPI003565CCC5